MKKVSLAIILFVATFVVSYLACCYLIPGWRIKLDAPPLTYFLESIKNMTSLKCAISLTVGAIVSAIPVISSKITKIIFVK